MIVPTSVRRFLAVALSLMTGLAAVGPLQAQTAPAQPLDPLALAWPRTFATNGYEFAVYQPQIANWPGNQLEGRFATAVRPAGTSNEWACFDKTDRENGVLR